MIINIATAMHFSKMLCFNYTKSYLLNVLAVVTIAHGSFPMSHSPKPGTMRIGSGLLLFRELILLLFFNQAEQLVEILCGNIRQLCDAYAFHFRHSFSNRRNIGWLIGFTTKRHGCQIW